jgi:hypothetical protein
MRVALSISNFFGQTSQKKKYSSNKCQISICMSFSGKRRGFFERQILLILNHLKISEEKHKSASSQEIN